MTRNNSGDSAAALRPQKATTLALSAGYFKLQIKLKQNR